MLYSWNHMATVGVKGLIDSRGWLHTSDCGISVAALPNNHKCLTWLMSDMWLADIHLIYLLETSDHLLHVCDLTGIRLKRKIHFNTRCYDRCHVACWTKQQNQSQVSLLQHRPDPVSNWTKIQISQKKTCQGTESPKHLRRWDQGNESTMGERGVPSSWLGSIVFSQWGPGQCTVHAFWCILSLKESIR